MRVLLAGGKAAGRIVTVADDAASVTVAVQSVQGEEPPITEQKYEPTGEMSTSGFTVWAVKL